MKSLGEYLAELVDDLELDVSTAFSPDSGAHKLISIRKYRQEIKALKSKINKDRIGNFGEAMTENEERKEMEDLTRELAAGAAAKIDLQILSAAMQKMRSDIELLRDIVGSVRTSNYMQRPNEELGAVIKGILLLNEERLKEIMD